MDGISLGPILLRWNGLLIALGIACGALLAAFEARRRFQETEIIYYLFVPLLIWAWIGARLWHVFTPPLSSIQLGLTTRHYLSNPLDILAFWVGGFGIPGAILGGALALWVISRRDKLPFWDIADAFAPGLALAHAIGRVGNYFNQELYGLPTTLPWAVLIEPEHRLQGYEQIEYYHPLFAYESLLVLGCAVMLMWLARGRFSTNLTPGDLFLTYLSFYSFIRCLLEILRLDIALVHAVNINQLFFALLFLLSAGILAYRRFARVL
ncbi:MAG: prolipoprotein diacylglyceryl transferase [Chloroflexi bacterium]|nr:prolipoprotein diacylglyceryl transferase [Chloroflexota bacterium]